MAQYPLIKEAVEDIRPIIEYLIQQGIIIPCFSEFSTPILPIKKAKLDENGKVIYTFIQDLRAPKTKKHLRAILGTTGFYRQWIPVCSEFMKCLIDLTRNYRTQTSQTNA